MDTKFQPPATTRERVRGCLLGIAVGDALGVPWETRSPEEILAATEGRGVTGYVSPELSGIPDMRRAPLGATSDDWQLTSVVGQSLLRTGGRLDLVDCANGHVRALAETTFGWGGTTRVAIEDIRDGRRHPLDPLPPPKPGHGGGNGVVMKVAPLAICSALRGDDPGEDAVESDPLMRETLALGGLTHADPFAQVAAYPVARVIRRLILGLCVENGWATYARADATMGAAAAQQHLGIDHRHPDGVVDALVRSQERGGAKPFYAAARAEKVAFRARETAAVALAVFFEGQWRDELHGKDPSRRFAATISATIGLGGDTDTNASIVGAMLGAQLGVEGIPPEWRAIPSAGEAVDLADKLCDLFAAD